MPDGYRQVRYPIQSILEKTEARRTVLRQPKEFAEAFAEVCAMDAPLSERLAAYVRKLRDANSEFASAYDRLVERLAAGKSGHTAPKVGAVMPPFLLPSHAGGMVALGALLRSGPVVVSFNRGHWCTFCKLELRAFAESHEAIAAHGGRVVSIMPERQAYTRRANAEQATAVTVLTDIDNGYALSLGLVIWVGPEVQAIMSDRGACLPELQGNDGWLLPTPATFVVGRDGRIAARFVDPDFRRRQDMEQIVAVLKGLAARAPA